jgi:uncharacterized FAD-dependent dehydrogenase
MIRISNIKINIKEATTHHKEIEMLRNKIISKLNIKASEPIDYKIFKKSIDARKKDTIYYIYTVDVQVPNEQKILRKYGHKGITITPDMTYKHVPLGTEKMEYPPVIIGMGPAGLFAGLILSKLGYSPILLERGEEVDTRTVKVHSFWMNGKLDPESNVQFGEGGAGTFSDGKLTTLIHDKRCRKVLEKFIQAGAPEEILYTHKPHVGTDL